MMEQVHLYECICFMNLGGNMKILQKMNMILKKQIVLVLCFLLITTGVSPAFADAAAEPEAPVLKSGETSLNLELVKSYQSSDGPVHVYLFSCNSVPENVTLVRDAGTQDEWEEGTGTYITDFNNYEIDPSSGEIGALGDNADLYSEGVWSIDLNNFKNNVVTKFAERDLGDKYNTKAEYYGIQINDVIEGWSDATIYNVYIEVKPQEVIAAPEATVPAGQYDAAQQISFTLQDGEQLYYTLDGTDPTAAENSPVLWDKTPINVDRSMTVEAVIKKGDTYGTVGIFKYTIKAGTPTADLAGGTYFAPVSVELHTTTDDADIYYTLDGSEPTVNSSKYENSITIEDATVLKAIAVKTGIDNSTVMTEKYFFRSEGETDTPVMVDEYYEIGNADQLMWYLELIRGSGNEQNTAAKAKLVNDINMTGRVLPRNTAKEFSGEFDGNGHKIYNLSVKSEGTDRTLFGSNHGVIKNLTVDFGSASPSSNGFGILCGYNYGTIENCNTKGNLIVSQNEIRYIGGICGFNKETITKCSHEGDITATAGSCIGGIAGINQGTIEWCYNRGSIFADTRPWMAKYIGGITGQNFFSGQDEKSVGTIRNCYNLGLLKSMTLWPSDGDQGAQYYGNWTGSGIQPIAGLNNSDGRFTGTVQDCYYLDYVSNTYKTDAGIRITLDNTYRAWATESGVFSIAGWTYMGEGLFHATETYYAVYDRTNDHFIVIGFSDEAAAASTKIDAKAPSDKKITATLTGVTNGPSKDFYLVTVPAGTTSVSFENTDEIVDYTLGMNNKFFDVYNTAPHSSVTGIQQMLFGDAVTGTNVQTVLNKVKSDWNEAYNTIYDAFSPFIGTESSNPEEEENVKVTFQLIGATLSEKGVDYDKNVNDSKFVTWIQTRTYTMPVGSTVGDLLKKACDQAGLNYTGMENGYISQITAPSVLGGYALAEFTNGPRSGWMYTVNGKHPSVALTRYKLSENDSVVWHYVNDYSYEVSDWWADDPAFPQKGNASTWDPWLKVADVDPTANMGEETQPVTQDVTASVKDGEATSKITTSDVDKLVDAAVKQSATTIGINVKGADKANKMTVELPKASVSDIANKTNAALQVTTPQGIVNMDQAAMKEAVKAASGSDLTIVLEKQTVSDADQNLLGGGAAQTKVSILSGGKEITDLGSGKVKISLPVTSDLKDKELAAVYTDSEGKLVKVSGKLVTIDGKQYYQIETSRPETFVLAEAAKVDAAIKAQGGETDEEKLERIKAGVEGTAIQLRSKLNKRSIKLTWTKSKGYKVDGYQLYRSTKKSSGYKKYVTTKKLTYTNKAKLKKGTRYYYKVRGYRVIDGKTYYTQWSNKAYRLMKANSVDYGVKKTTVKVKAAASKGAVKVTWTKSKGYKVDGYQVYRSTSKTKNFKKLGTTAKTTYKNTKSLKKGTTYYYKVRGYRVVDGKKVYTKWSETVSVKAK